MVKLILERGVMTMEEMTTYISSLGVCGFIAYTLFNKLIKDTESDKNYYREQISIMHQESKADREIYINSINAVVDRLENVEKDISEIKEIISK